MVESAGGERRRENEPAAAHLAGASGPSVERTEVDEITSALCELAGQINAANAELVELLARFDALGGWQGAGIRSIGHWASINLGIDMRTAAQQARVGRQLGELPAIAEAAAGGELGWSKLRLLGQVAEPATEDKWLAFAREMSVGQLARVVGAYRRAEDADRRSRLNDHRERRGIWLFDEPDGLVRVNGLLEADDAAVLRAALAAQGELLWREQINGEDDDIDRAGTAPADGNGHTAATASTADADAESAASAGRAGSGCGANGADAALEDDDMEGEPASLTEVDPTRAARDAVASRRVDALVALARAALAQGRPDDGDDLTEVLLVVDADVLSGHAEVGRCQLNGGPTLSTPTARRLCCDARIRPLLHRDGQPLDLGRSQRLVSRAQRRALRFRDGPGCAFPGCPARHVDAHHVQHWSDGGSTDLDNLILLCRHHHRLLHEGGYTARLEDGRPRFYRPDGTPIRPPNRPHPHHRYRARGRTITAHTARARSGGAPHWSPRYALDALFSSR